MSKNWRLMASLLVVLCGQNLYAQKRTLGVDEMFRLADENSKSIQVKRTGEEASREALKAAKAQRLPDVGVSASVSYIGNGYLMNRHFKEGMSVSMPHFGNNFALEAQQVIYAGGAVNSGIELAELGTQMAGLDVRKNQQEIRFLLIGFYLDLFKLHNQRIVLEKNLDLTEQVIRHMEARRSQGTALKNDITRYELQRENLKLQLSKIDDAYKILNHQLVTTLHLPAETVIEPDSTLLDSEIKTYAESDWQQMADQNNVGLQQTELAVRISEQKQKLEKSEFLPKIAVVAEEHLDGPILIEVPVINSNFNYWFVGVGIKYNLSSLFKNNRKLRNARLNTVQARQNQELVREHVENAVQANYVNYLTSYTELRTQEKSVELANQNYEVTANRYQNELALLTDMLDASNTKLDADLGLVNARINVIYSYYKMKYTTHTL